MKKFLIKIRTFLKFFILILISVFLIIGTIAIIYKPIYSVYIDGNLVGYCEDKGKLQSRISEYMEKGDENIDNTNLAYISIDNLPTYKMCLLKRGITTNDDEIFQMVKETGVPYYKYFAILDDDDEVIYVSQFKTARNILKQLKKKDSENFDDLSILEKYESELKNFSSEEDAISKLYVKKKEKKSAPNVNNISISNVKVSTSFNLSSSKPSLGISLIRPVNGSISSRFGSISSVRSGIHTGLDIAAPGGTSIKSASDGVVVFAGYKGSFGKMVAIAHGNNVLTYYGHCSRLYVSRGQKISQGSTIAAVGSTGNSTGCHLHFEIRVNGVAYNPQKYIY